MLYIIYNKFNLIYFKHQSILRDHILIEDNLLSV